jgi:PST family polysaccharide transporter
MALVVAGVGLVLAEAGLRPALIQQIDLSPPLAAGAFWTALAAGSALMIVVLVGAPLAGAFYREPRVVPVLRALSLLLPISAARVALIAVLERRLAFRRLAVFELASTVCGAVAGTASAATGLHVWSLVIQSLTGSLSLTGLLVLFGGRTPWSGFHWRAVRPIAGYAVTHTGARLVEYLSRNLHDLLIGRAFGVPGLGHYSIAYQIALFPVLAVSRLVARVLFPALASVQGDDERMARLFRDFAVAVATITFPVMLGLWAVADVFVTVALGPRWDPVRELIRILAPIGALQSVTVLADSVLLAKGRVDLQMRWNVLQGVSVLGGILVGLRWGLVGVAVAYAVVVLALAYPWLRLATGLLRLPLIHVTRGLLRPLLATAVMVVSVTGARAWLLAGQRPVAELVLAAVIGAGAYLGAILWIGERRVLVVARDLFAR